MVRIAPSTGVVLAGAAALGAYEVGVVSYLYETVVPGVGGAGPDVFSGTSAGAINATALAAFADDPRIAVRMLTRAWSELSLSRVLRPSAIELLSMLLDVTGTARSVGRALHVRSSRGGLLEAEPIAKLVGLIPTDRLIEQLHAGHLRGLAISATRIADGTAVVFYAAPPHVQGWRSDSNVEQVAAHITGNHVLASAAIPLLFPSVIIDGQRYCDGGLRQMVPLSPAIHLGAERLIVVNPLPAARAVPAHAGSVTSPLYLAGKALNALFADRVEVDLAQLARTTAILRAGTERFGPAFQRELNDQLVKDGRPELHTVDALAIEPSRDLGTFAAEYITTPAFARTGGPAVRLLRCIADGDPARMGDLLAYLLFDGGFTAELIELGRADARRHQGALEVLLGGRQDRPQARAG